MSTPAKNPASLWQIFGVFSKIGAFTIGGGYAMIPIIEREMLKRQWVAPEEIDDVVVLAQSAPGLLAVNMAIFAGYKIRGIRGSIAATIGAVLPSFIMILLIAMFFTAFRENAIIQRIFQGLRPVAIALILVPAVNMALKSRTKWWAWVLTAATVVAVAFLKVSAVWIILAVLASALGIALIREGRRK
ncbi:MAG: chromate transporter [Bacteroidales bacterium]|nr:chromate transporter [Bacteroidales bacterium]